VQRIGPRGDAPLGDAVARVDLVPVVAARRGLRHRRAVLVVVAAVAVARDCSEEAPPEVRLVAPGGARDARVTHPGQDRLVGGGRQLRRAPAARRRRWRWKGGAEEEQGRQEDDAEGPRPRTPHGCAGHARAIGWPDGLFLLRRFLEGRGRTAECASSESAYAARGGRRKRRVTGSLS
jgi:hypothetical protein